MNKPVQTQTSLPSKSDGDEAMCKVCTWANALRTALEAIEAGIQIATYKSTAARPLTEQDQYLHPLNEKEKEKLAQCREALCSGLASTRYQRGKLLSEYRAAFRGSGSWMQALTAIANSEGVVINTIRNYIRDYEAAMTLPETARSALTDQGIDPAKMKNRAMVGAIADRLHSEPKEPDRERASQIVEEVRRVRVKSDPIEKPDPDDEFEDDEFEPLTREEMQIHHVRTAIRGAVASISKGWRLELVIEALEQEMYMVWRQRERAEIVLCPHRSRISVDGRKLKFDDDTQEVA